MTKKEWPLIFFTLLVQMAVGALLVLATVVFIDDLDLPKEISGSLSLTLSLVIPPLLVLGLLSAILHLSRPGIAKLALTNMKKMLRNFVLLKL